MDACCRTLRRRRSVWAQRLCEGYDGIYFDTVPPDVAGVGRNSAVLEYPRVGRGADKWLRDLQMLFAQIKIAMPDKMITGNAGNAFPMVNDGRQSEGWQRVSGAEFRQPFALLCIGAK